MTMLGRKSLVRKTDTSALTPWTPFRELEDVQNVVSSALEDFFQGGLDIQAASHAWLPAVDVEERDKDYVFSVEVPGVEKDQVRVELQNGSMIISGERKEEKEEKRKNYLRHEQSFGAFRRQFAMPQDAASEGLKATYKNGLLKITVPRLEKAKAKTVPINVE